MKTLPGFSAHADQKDLLAFIGRMRKPPLAALLRQQHPGLEVAVLVG